MSSMANVMQQMLNFVMVTENQNGDAIEGLIFLQIFILKKLIILIILNSIK